MAKGEAPEKYWKGEDMTTRVAVVAAVALMIALPTIASAKKKKTPVGMLESMQSVPCGVKEHGITGLGSIWASAGVHHVNSDEKLCAQYLFRTDDMDYHIRPEDMKHAVLLPVGHEAEYKIKKNRLFLKVPDGGDKKTRKYQVISMEPKNSQGGVENTSYSGSRSAEYRRTENLPPTGRPTMNQTAPPMNQTAAPPQGVTPPQNTSPPE